MVIPSSLSTANKLMLGCGCLTRPHRWRLSKWDDCVVAHNFQLLAQGQLRIGSNNWTLATIKTTTTMHHELGNKYIGINYPPPLQPITLTRWYTNLFLVQPDLTWDNRPTQIQPQFPFQRFFVLFFLLYSERVKVCLRGSRRHSSAIIAPL